MTMPQIGQIKATKKLRGSDRKDGAKSLALVVSTFQVSEWYT